MKLMTVSMSSLLNVKNADVHLLVFNVFLCVLESLTYDRIVELVTLGHILNEKCFTSGYYNKENELDKGGASWFSLKIFWFVSVL